MFSSASKLVIEKLKTNLKSANKKSKQKKTSETATTLCNTGLDIVNDVQRHCVKSVRIRSYFGPYFPAFGLNTEKYGVSLHIQFECGKICTRITPTTDAFHVVRSPSSIFKSVTIIDESYIAFSYLIVRLTI